MDSLTGWLWSASGKASDPPQKKWTSFRIILPAAQIQPENKSLTLSVDVFCCKNA